MRPRPDDQLWVSSQCVSMWSLVQTYKLTAIQRVLGERAQECVRDLERKLDDLWLTERTPITYTIEERPIQMDWLVVAQCYVRQESPYESPPSGTVQRSNQEALAC